MTVLPGQRLCRLPAGGNYGLAYAQWAALPHIATSALQPGDLVFFGGIGHFAMYVGNGYIIDAPQTGMNVQTIAVSGWYASAYVGAARL